MNNPLLRVIALALLLCLSTVAGAQEAAAGDDGDAAAADAAPVDPLPRFRLLGFTDFNYSETTQSEGTASGFFEGQFVLHFTSTLTERFTFFAEVSTSANTSANTSASTPAFRTEVERAILKYAHNDLVKLSAGRYHTPISYWNAAFHHGQWLQTTISRPEMIRFGGEFLPVHFVGASLEGLHPAAGVNLGYSIGIGNGRSDVHGRAGDAGDVNDSRAVAIGLTAKPNLWYGLRVGASMYSDSLRTPAADYDELITSAHLAWERQSPEIVAEAVRVRHRPTTGGDDATSTAYYIQAAYRLRGATKWKPYARWERMNVDGDDLAFQSVPSVKLLTAGVRYDVADVVALKAEYRRNWLDTPYRRGWFAQLSFTF